MLSCEAPVEGCTWNQYCLVQGDGLRCLGVVCAVLIKKYLLCCVFTSSIVEIARHWLALVHLCGLMPND